MAKGYAHKAHTAIEASHQFGQRRSGVIGEVIFEPVNELGHVTAVDVLDNCRFRQRNINLDRQNGRGYTIDSKPTPKEQVDDYSARWGR